METCSVCAAIGLYVTEGLWEMELVQSVSLLTELGLTTHTITPRGGTVRGEISFSLFYFIFFFRGFAAVILRTHTHTHAHVDSVCVNAV